MRQDGDGRLSLLAEGMADMAWTAEADGRCDWCNAQALEATGLAADRFLGFGWLDAVHDQDRRAVEQRWSVAREAGAPLRMEARITDGTGRSRWHLLRIRPCRGHDHGPVEAWVATCADIDDQKQTALLLAQDVEQLEQDIFKQLHEVQRSQSRLQTYFDACPDYLYMLRLSHEKGLTYEDVNPAAERLFGLERSAIIGRSPYEIDDPETAAGIDAAVRQCLHASRSITHEGRQKFGAGPSVLVQVVGAPLEYSNEEEGVVLFCGRDVTEQRSVEEALRQSQKMEAVGQLTGGLAHDFNNLLTGITGSLDLLQMRIAQGRYDSVERYVKAAQGAAARAAALTHRLLAFSRRQTLDPKATDVNALVAGMEDLLKRTVGPEIALTVAAFTDLWPVLVDPSQLENALLNLCINARDALPDGGRIMIETANLTLDGRGGEERDLPAGHYVSLSVSDNGTGMPPEVQARIFDPFFTTKPLGMGTGLGLSMIYGFARQSGGQVRVHSAEGMGTTMRILLPRFHGRADAGSERTELATAPRSEGSESVLLVDDEVTVRMLASEVLRDLGYSVTQAADGKAAVEILRSDQVIDVLVTDVGLPGGVNGRQVADAGRQCRPGLKVLFITGYAENAIFNHGHLEPGMQVITKPFSMETLATRVKQLIGEP